MKRIHLIETVEPEYMQLLPELWIEILALLTTRQRYLLITVCNTWGKDGGLIDLSMRSLKHRHTQTFHSTTRLINLTKVEYSPSSLIKLASYQLNKICSISLNKVHSHWCDEVSLLVNLTSLKMDHNAYLNIGSLASLLSLTRLMMHAELVPSECIETDINILRSLTALVDLSLSIHPMFTDTHMSVMTNLRSLRIYKRRTVTEVSIATLTRLEYLHLSSIWFSNLFHSLTRLKSLKFGHFVKGNADHLTHLTSLTSLKLSCDVKNRTNLLRSCPMLTSLELRGNPHNDDDYRFMNHTLCTLTKLTKLKFSDSNRSYVSNTTIKSLVNLTSLSIEDRSLTCNSSSFFSYLPNLRHIKVNYYHTYITTANTHIPSSVYFPMILDTLDIKCGIAYIPLLQSFATRLTNLTKLSIYVEDVDEDEMIPVWQSYTTLTSLKILKCIYPSTARMYLPSVEEITHC